MSEELYYNCRCDKHAFSPHEYCEMCMMRSRLQDTCEKVRKDAQSMLGETWLAIQVLNDCFDKLQREINEIKKKIQK